MLSFTAYIIDFNLIVLQFDDAFTAILSIFSIDALLDLWNWFSIFNPNSCLIPHFINAFIEKVNFKHPKQSTKLNEICLINQTIQVNWEFIPVVRIRLHTQ